MREYKTKTVWRGSKGEWPNNKELFRQVIFLERLGNSTTPPLRTEVCSFDLPEGMYTLDLSNIISYLNLLEVERVNKEEEFQTRIWDQYKMALHDDRMIEKIIEGLKKNEISSIN